MKKNMKYYIMYMVVVIVTIIAVGYFFKVDKSTLNQLKTILILIVNSDIYMYVFAISLALMPVVYVLIRARK